METYDEKFDFRDKRNLSLVTDFYELTMSQCYFNAPDANKIVTFDLFYRRNPDNGGFAIFAGLEQIIGFIQNLHFEDEDIAYLKSLNKFSDEFLDYLRHFIFTGDVYAVPEGTPVFPNEPLVRVKAKIIEAQLLETAFLLAINHQTLIATKANRIVRAAKGRIVMEFGARRAHNFDAANYGATAVLMRRRQPMPGKSSIFRLPVLWRTALFSLLILNMKLLRPMRLLIQTAAQCCLIPMIHSTAALRMLSELRKKCLNLLGIV